MRAWLGQLVAAAVDPLMLMIAAPASSECHLRTCSPLALTAPLEPFAHVPPLNPTPQGAANSTCFRKLARFYAKDVKLMFPSLYATWGGEEASPAAAAAAATAGGGQQLVWRRSRMRLE